MNTFRALWVLIALTLSVAAQGMFGADAETATPTTGTPAAVTSRVLAAASPAAVEDPVLALGVVTVEPGAAIPPHVHPGTQIGTIAAGQLTYTVLTGEVRMHRGGDGSDGTVVPIRAGETVVLGAGDTVVEQPGAVHHARNEGSEMVVIWLSTLFPDGAPRAEYVEATPVP